MVSVGNLFWVMFLLVSCMVGVLCCVVRLCSRRLNSVCLVLWKLLSLMMLFGVFLKLFSVCLVVVIVLIVLVLVVVRILLVFVSVSVLFV